MNSVTINKINNRYKVTNNKDNVTYSISRHNVTKKSKHPFIDGFSKIAFWGNYYNRIKAHRKPTMQIICNYWENIGAYMLDVIVKSSNK